MAQKATSTATLRLGIGDLKIVHPVTVPSGPVRASERSEEHTSELQSH